MDGSWRLASLSSRLANWAVGLELSNGSVLKVESARLLVVVVAVLQYHVTICQARPAEFVSTVARHMVAGVFILLFAQIVTLWTLLAIKGPCNFRESFCRRLFSAAPLVHIGRLVKARKLAKLIIAGGLLPS